MIKLRRVAAVLAAVTIGLAAGCQQAHEPPTPGNVAILVLDQFSTRSVPSLSPPKEPAGKPHVENCPYSGLPTNVVGSGGGGDGLPLGVSHGQAVYRTVKDELNRQGLNHSDQAPEIGHHDVRGVDVWRHNNHTVTLVGVDIARYNTEKIRENILELMTIMKGNDFQVTKFVLNMSFLILPCHLEKWYKENPGDPDPSITDMIQAISDSFAGIETLQDFKNTLDTLVGQAPTLQQLLSDKKLVKIRDIVLTNLVMGRLYKEVPNVEDLAKSSLRKTWYDSDLLRVFLQESTTAGYKVGGDEVQVMPVGAAGNGVFLPGTATRKTFGFAFPPALWNSVVSVSAADMSSIRNGVPQGPAAYSNSGEVMMEADNYYKASGTSFAAPHFSALAALYLLNAGTTWCDGPGGVHVPALGYADSDQNVYTWGNLWLATGPGSAPVTGAATSKCPNFATLAN